MKAQTRIKKLEHRRRPARGLVVLWPDGTRTGDTDSDNPITLRVVYDRGKDDDTEKAA